jgi:ppGpp synthetase/RelA/SpoT-type nucleotidyltranferase
MITDQSLSTYYDATKEIFARSRDDILFFLNRKLQDAEPEICRIYASSRLSDRVKPYESLLRKVRRDGVDEIEVIPEKVEDIIGIRISTPNKVQAKKLFDWFRAARGNWFCNVSAEPKFVPYTLEERNGYSLRTGYQAYQITFVFERGFLPFTVNRRWPCEIQIMSQVWEFWANYSRNYFYGNLGASVARLLPYNVAISRILDSADDLMVATAELLLEGEVEPDQLAVESSCKTNLDQNSTNIDSIVTPRDVQLWLAKNISKLFGEEVRVPNELFLTKIANELNTYEISLPKLEEIVKNEGVVQSYQNLLRGNNLAFLPLYQQILCMILLYLDRDIRKVVDRLNSELMLLGIRLHVVQSGTESNA